SRTEEQIDSKTNEDISENRRIALMSDSPRAWNESDESGGKCSYQEICLGITLHSYNVEHPRWEKEIAESRNGKENNHTSDDDGVNVLFFHSCKCFLALVWLRSYATRPFSRHRPRRVPAPLQAVYATPGLVARFQEEYKFKLGIYKIRFEERSSSQMK